MEFTPSDYIAATALLIAIASAYYTKKQSDQAKISSHNDYRAHLAEKHDDYRKALKEATEKHKLDIRRLSTEAGSALNLIICLFDRYDTKPNVTRPLRHLIHECSEMVYYAFKGQLGWQTGLNISHRFAQVMHAEIRSSITPSTLDFGAYRSSFEQQYLKNPNVFQEAELLSSAYFLDMVSQVRERMDASKCGDLLLEIQEILLPLNRHLQEIQQSIGETAERLEELLEDNELDQFSLDESPKLYDRLRYRKSTYETLSHLRPHEVDSSYADKYYNFVSVSIYNCAILQALQGFESWGWSVAHRRV